MHFLHILLVKLALFDNREAACLQPSECHLVPGCILVLRAAGLPYVYFEKFREIPERIQGNPWEGSTIPPLY